jgi:hypothetical protein
VSVEVKLSTFYQLGANNHHTSYILCRTPRATDAVSSIDSLPRLTMKRINQNKIPGHLETKLRRCLANNTALQSRLDMAALHRIKDRYTDYI